MKKKKSDFFRKYHKWLGLIVTFNLLLFALSGIILNHRNIVARFDVPRTWLPDAYQIKNWNNGVVKGSINIGKDSVLLFGNSGLLLTNSTFTSFQEFNKGIPQSTDYRKTETALHFNDSIVYIGTQHGLYTLNKTSGAWEPMLLQGEEKRVVSLSQFKNTLYVLTRSEIFAIEHLAQGKTHIKHEHVPAHLQNAEVGLFRTLWVIHSGEIYGYWGKLLVDFLGICVILLSISGLVYFIIPKYLKRKRDMLKEKMHQWKMINRKTLWLHNNIGVWLLPLLLLNTITGIFLRPPFLIPIANSTVPPIPYSTLAAQNYWEDKLRRMEYDSDMGTFLLFTSEGVYTYMPFTGIAPSIIPHQPTISVMGINVCKKVSPGTYLIGSFSGLYIWNFAEAYQINAVTLQNSLPENKTARPIGENIISGLVMLNDTTYTYIDYDRGAIPLHHQQSFAAMPSFMQETQMPLWNLALEIHTARIFQGILGDFYILIVPLVGLMTIFILISGVIVWYRIKYSRKNKNDLQAVKVQSDPK